MLQEPGQKGQEAFPPRGLPYISPLNCVWLCKPHSVNLTLYGCMAGGIQNGISLSRFCGTFVLRIEQEKKFFGHVSLKSMYTTVYIRAYLTIMVKYGHIKGSERSCI